MASKYNLFISYAHEDGDIAASLASRLDDAGLHCFLAERDIDPSEVWEPRIHDALCSSQSVLLLLTPRSRESRWVNAEAGAAWALRKPLIPALMFVEPDELIELIRCYQAYRVETPQQVESLIDKLRPARKVLPAATAQQVRFPPNDKLTPAEGDQTNRAVTIGQQAAQTIKTVTFDLDGTLIPGPTHGSIRLSPEVFNDAQHWDRLLKIGKWTLDETTGEFAGKGMRTYLLSQVKYRPHFSISTRLCFVEGHPINAVDAINAGIVLGWDTPDGTCRYHHLMFTGTHVLVELVGGRGGSECGDYRHLDEGIPFALKEGREYALCVTVEPKGLTLIVDDKTQYTIALPYPCEGRVGLRPWRSTMKCRHFEVTGSLHLPF